MLSVFKHAEAAHSRDTVCLHDILALIDIAMCACIWLCLSLKNDRAHAIQNAHRVDLSVQVHKLLFYYLCFTSPSAQTSRPTVCRRSEWQGAFFSLMDE